MSTIEDFKSAPVGAMATNKATGNRAVRVEAGEQFWPTAIGLYLSDEEMEGRGFTLDPKEGDK